MNGGQEATNNNREQCSSGEAHCGICVQPLLLKSELRRLCQAVVQAH